MENRNEIGNAAAFFIKRSSNDGKAGLIFTVTPDAGRQKDGLPANRNWPASALTVPLLITALFSSHPRLAVTVTRPLRW